jgi:L-2-hydroxyglutarate oxidase LhgO
MLRLRGPYHQEVEMVADIDREEMFRRVREGSVIVVLDPQECETMRDILSRLTEADLRHEDRLKRFRLSK